MHENFARKYERIRYTLDNSTLLPWTRRGLEAVATEIFQADRALNFDIGRNADVAVNLSAENLRFIANAIEPRNHNAIINFMIQEKSNPRYNGQIKNLEGLLNEVINGKGKIEEKLSPDARVFLNKYSEMEKDYSEQSFLWNIPRKIKGAIFASDEILVNSSVIKVKEVFKTSTLLNVDIHSNVGITMDSFKENFGSVHNAIKARNKNSTIDFMMKQKDNPEYQGKIKDLKDLLESVAKGEILADAKVSYNARVFLKEYEKADAYYAEPGFFKAISRKIKDLIFGSGTTLENAFQEINQDKIELLKNDAVVCQETANDDTLIKKHKKNRQVNSQGNTAKNVARNILYYGARAAGIDINDKKTVEKFASYIEKATNLTTKVGIFSLYEHSAIESVSKIV